MHSYLCEGEELGRRGGTSISRQVRDTCSSAVLSDLEVDSHVDVCFDARTATWRSWREWLRQSRETDRHKLVDVSVR